ncbi:ABC transporter ATP-binding protein [Mycoplasmopsis pullorum]|uniref:ABC transporter ATP-binding protein n=1 Tax=Mycoplasmopsis pullorum TaxID=48003 RepID=UPI00111A3D2B|nr:ABC transporter ATP-binding protein [Mycoplasmopsis pullorum]TNK87762.1 ABC transporter ATP-binding protein [Mycoplasmopsis pullorum]
MFFKKNKNPEESKVNVNNVFNNIESKKEKQQKDVSQWIVRKLKKASNKKRKKDENFKLKNEPGNIVDVVNVSKYYLTGNTITKVLESANLEIKRGEFIVIFGKSGSGKSTLLNLISGLDRPSNGQVIVNDTNLPYLSDNQLTQFRRKNVSFIFQNYNLLQNLTGYDNVETGAYLQKDKTKKQDIEQMFKEYEIEDIMDKYPSQMSGGQQQRVSILRALSKNADIIFADEPTGALDEATSRIVLTSLFNINKQNGTTIIMVSHDPDIKKIAHRIVYVKEGKITGTEVNSNPKHPSEVY